MPRYKLSPEEWAEEKERKENLRNIMKRLKAIIRLSAHKNYLDYIIILEPILRFTQNEGLPQGVLIILLHVFKNFIYFFIRFRCSYIIAFTDKLICIYIFLLIKPTREEARSIGIVALI